MCSSTNPGERRTNTPYCWAVSDSEGELQGLWGQQQLFQTHVYHRDGQTPATALGPTSPASRATARVPALLPHSTPGQLQGWGHAGRSWDQPKAHFLHPWLQAGGGDAVCPALGDTRHGSEARVLAATTLRPGLSPELLGKGPPRSAGAAKLVGEDPRAASRWVSPQGELEPSQHSWEQSWGWRRKWSPGGWAGGPQSAGPKLTPAPTLTLQLSQQMLTFA